MTLRSHRNCINRSDASVQSTSLKFLCANSLELTCSKCGVCVSWFELVYEAHETCHSVLENRKIAERS